MNAKQCKTHDPYVEIAKKALLIKNMAQSTTGTDKSRFLYVWTVFIYLEP
jgi:hypothetical protein